MKKIASKLMAAMLLLSIITTLILWVYQGFFLEKAYIKDQQKRLMTNVAALVTQITTNPDVVQFSEQSDTLAYQYGLNVEWYDETGKLQYNNQSTKGRMHLVGTTLLSGAYLETLTSEGKVFAMAALGRQNSKLMVYAQQIPQKGIIVGSMPVESITQTVKLLQKQLLGIAAIHFVIASGIGVYLAIRLTRPIRHLNGAVRQVAKGDLSVRAVVTGKDELFELAQSINHMTESLGKIEVLRNDLIANVSHELRTPLGIIRGYAEMLLDFKDQDLEHREGHIAMILDETIKLSELVTSLLDLSQLQSGTVKMVSEPTDLVRLCQAQVNKFSGLAESSGQSLSFETQSQQMLVLADPRRVVQMLSNLLSNALKHTPDKGHITVLLSERGNGLGRLTVVDTGKGIAESDLVRIWERYYQGNTDISEDALSLSGAGLGLAIVKQLAHLQGITCSVESALGVGTTFNLDFELMKKTLKD